MDNTEINKFNDLRRIVSPNPNKNLLFLIERDGKNMEIDVVPSLTEVRDASGTMIKVGLLGVTSVCKLVPSYMIQLVLLKKR